MMDNEMRLKIREQVLDDLIQRRDTICTTCGSKIKRSKDNPKANSNHTFSPAKEETLDERRTSKAHGCNQMLDVKSGNADGGTEIQAERNKKNPSFNAKANQKGDEDG